MNACNNQKEHCNIKRHRRDTHKSISYKTQLQGKLCLIGGGQTSHVKVEENIIKKVKKKKRP